MLSCYEIDEVLYYMQELVVIEREEDFHLDAVRRAHHLQYYQIQVVL